MSDSPDLQACAATHPINGGMVLLICDQSTDPREHSILHHDSRHHVWWSSDGSSDVTDSAATDLSRFARDTPDEPLDMTDVVQRNGCTRKDCGRPMSEHEWGVFCP